MAETITPVVHGGRAKWLTALALHVVGATVAASAFGAALGWIGRLLGAPWGSIGWLAVALLAVLFAAAELLPSVSIRVPQLRRQVPDWWRTFFGGPATAFLYGAGLCIGFFTFLSNGSLVVTASAAVVIGRPEVGAVVVGAFGLARGLTAIVGSGVDTAEEGRAVVDRLAGRSDRPRRVANGVALVVVSALSAVAAVHAVGSGRGRFASAVLAIVFGWAAVWKASASRRWRRALAGHRLPIGAERALVWVVPVLEGAVPVLALLGLPRVAATWALTLVTVFTIEVVRLWLVAGPKIACGCFGGRRESDATTLLARNAVLAATAWIAINGPGETIVVRWPGTPSADEILPMVLALVGILVAVSAAWRSGVWLGRGARR